MASQRTQALPPLCPPHPSSDSALLLRSDLLPATEPGLTPENTFSKSSLSTLLLDNNVPTATRTNANNIESTASDEDNYKNKLLMRQ